MDRRLTGRAGRRRSGPLVAAGLLLCGLCGCADRLVARLPEVSYGVGDPEFVRTVSSVVGAPMVDGNRVTTLTRPGAIVGTMLRELDAAERTITLETYVWWDSDVATRFARKLAERAADGVEVKVLVDAVGGDMSEDAAELMRSAGVDLAFFHPVARGLFDGTANLRTHRRVLVVDGRRALTGGAGIAQQWLQDSSRRGGAWRDTMFLVEGPVVAQLQGVFADNWLEATGEVLEGGAWFPPLETAGPHRAQAFGSSADGASKARVVVLLALAAAQERVRIMNAYFVPDELLVEAFVACEERGVEVQIIVPGPLTDLPSVRRASRHRWGPLLRAGVEIYEFMPTMYHCKVMVVDGLWVTGGTTNLDPRSFHLNDEVDLNVLDRDVAEEQVRAFQRDLQHCRRITLQDWLDRSPADRGLDWIASLFGATM